MPQVRVTAVLVERGRLLLVRQHVSADRCWSLPGGRVKEGETLAEAVVREAEEETGLRTSVRRLLYVADKPEDGVVHITFEVDRQGGQLRLPTNELDKNPITEVKFVALDDLESHGFSATWRDLVACGFADAPAYVGPKRNIGL